MSEENDSMSQKIIGWFIDAVKSGQIVKILRHASYPNIPLKTKGGHVMWNELAECKGWRLQKNMITQHCRILDPQDVRRAWGGDDAMAKLFSNLNK